MKKLTLIFILGILLVGLCGAALDTSNPNEQTLLTATQVNDISFCCEKTTEGAFCQNSPESLCDESYRTNPASCEATSFCKLGCCYDSIEGTCMKQTTEKVCLDNEGTWEDSADCSIPQCTLGCCVIGDQAAFVTLTRCKRLSSFFGLENDFRKNIRNEVQCISLAQAKDKGACVYYEQEGFEKTCKFTTREDCGTLVADEIREEENPGLNQSAEGFYKDYLCSAEKLGTNCGPTKKTACVDGKDGVYFLDSCGNLANVYDSSKFNVKSYWEKIISIEDSCNSDDPNIESKSCGNCNYIQGSICGAGSATYGDRICVDLNCKRGVTSDGKAHKHGESWCSSVEEEEFLNNPGARYFRHSCVQGEELIEPCADFRQEICIENVRDTFHEAACRVNRWQDCLFQGEEDDCENADRRDCQWIKGSIPGLEFTTSSGGSISAKKGVCVPLNAPGLKFWEQEASDICAQANAKCTIEYTEGLSGGQKCVKNCECEKDTWEENLNSVCVSLGDCGTGQNYIGEEGYKTKEKDREKKEDKDSTESAFEDASRGGAFGGEPEDE